MEVTDVKVVATVRELRLLRAEQVVLNQRDDDHPYMGAPEELARLQAAVMGEPDPYAPEVEIREEDLVISYYPSDVQLRSRDAALVPPIGVRILHQPSGIEVRQSKLGSRLKNTHDAMEKLRRELEAR